MRQPINTARPRSGLLALLTLAVLCSLCLLSLVLYAQTLPEPPNLALDGFDPEIKEQIQKAQTRLQGKLRDAEANGWLGMTLHTYEQYEGAAVCYERARRLAPTEFRWAYYLGIVQTALGKQAEAIAAFKAALKLDPNHLPAQLRLAEAALAANQVTESQQLYETLLKRNNKLAQVHYGLGRLATSNNKFADAAAHYRQAIELFPEYGAAHYALGMALRDLGQPAKAQEHLLRSQQLKLAQPTLDDPLIAAIAEMNAGASKHLKRGALLEAAGNLDESIAEHEQALELNPWLVQAHINLISLYGRTRQLEKAEKHYRVALTINPDLPDLHYNYGVLQVGQERPREAAQAFQRCLQLNPYYAEAHHNYAVLIEAEGKLDEAAQHYRKALENKPGYRSAHFLLGRILVNQNKLAEAITHFQQTLTPDDAETPRYLYALGATCIRAGQRTEGIQYLRDALKKAQAFNQTQLAASLERDLKLLEQRQ